jgi:hypothetical protein
MLEIRNRGESLRVVCFDLIGTLAWSTIRSKCGLESPARLFKFYANNLVVTVDFSGFATSFKKNSKNYCVLNIPLLELVPIAVQTTTYSGWALGKNDTPQSKKTYNDQGVTTCR